MQFPDKFDPHKTILCHDWLTGMRGGEKVLEILCDWFPKAEICTLICNTNSISEKISRHPVNTSCLQRFPGIFNNYRYMLPFFPAALKSIKVPEADMLISTSHCVAKSLPKPAGAKHLCYCFTPMRYVWLFHDEYLGRNPLKRILAAPLLAYMRAWDRKKAANVDMFVAISKHVADRINRFYKRDCEVVFPPVDTDRFTPSGEPADFDLIVSALVPYKKVDLAVNAYRRLDRKLKIAGHGTELERLKSKAGPNVEFLEWQSDEDILALYRKCRMLVFPGEEDFGIVPVEAQACGKPVVAYGKGGATESIRNGETGMFFEEQTPASLAATVKECAGREWNSSSIRDNALRFSTQTFIDELGSCIDKMLNSA